MSYEPMTGENPLLDIDTSFYSYLIARMRNYKEHISGGKLDYAFDADFALRQKISGTSGWSRLQKGLFTRDMPIKIKNAFRGANIAGSLKFADAYEAVKICAERLQMIVPVVFVRNVPDKYEIFSLSSDTDSYIILTSGLLDIAAGDELRFLVGCECGHIQNGHNVLGISLPQVGVNAADGLNDEADNRSEIGGQLETLITEWMGLANITSDRAGIICCDDPGNYPKVIVSLKKKGVADFYHLSDKGDGISEWSLNLDKLIKDYEVLHVTPARSIKLDRSRGVFERRVFAGMEFLNCETLYYWRPDLSREDIHIVNKQALEVRCEAIISG